MGLTKKEAERLFATDDPEMDMREFEAEEEEGVISGGPPKPPAPKPIYDFFKDITGLHDQLRIHTATLLKELNGMKSLSTEEIRGKGSDLVGTLYKYINEGEAANVTMRMKVYNGVILDCNTTATKMSGATHPLPLHLAYVCVAAVSRGIPEKMPISFEATCKFTIREEDGKLQMTYLIVSNETKVESYITLLDPDLLL